MRLYYKSFHAKTLLGFIGLAGLPLLLVGCIQGGVPGKEQIAILKYATHPALDEMENAYYENLSKSLSSDKQLSEKYEINKYNANGNRVTAKTIAESFGFKKVKLIFTIGTPAAQAVANTKSEIPFIYGAVADPQGAGVITPRSTGIQNAGESIVIQSLEFIHAAFPKAKVIGTIYNPSEQNSVYVQGFIKSNTEKMGLKLKQVSTAGTAELATLADALTNEVDVVYSANDNTVNAGITSIVAVCNKKKKPFVIGDLSTLSKGPLFAVGLEYSGMGKELANTTFQILSGKPISNFPPQSVPKGKIWVNNQTKKLLGYKYPDKKVELLVTGSVK